MVATDTQQDLKSPGVGEHSGSENRKATQAESSDSKLAAALGWFSVGLGLAELVTPGAMSGIIGVRNNSRTRGVLRGYGMREIAAGIGILTQSRPTGWLWARVAGDALDLSSLGSAFGSGRNDKKRLAVATAAVAGVTVLDVICAQRLSAEKPKDGGGKAGKKKAMAVRSIGVGASPEQAYSFWRNFDNLPRFMTYLESVRSTGDRRSHWTAVGPAGMKIEWDAELVRDEPNRLIAWKSVDATFANAGSVRFDRAPGQRGTVVRVEMDYAPNGGMLNSALGKILGKDIGQRIMHDLRNFKQMLELGEVTQSDASIHSSMHAAQPPERQPA